MYIQRRAAASMEGALCQNCNSTACCHHNYCLPPVVLDYSNRERSSAKNNPAQASVKRRQETRTSRHSTDPSNKSKIQVHSTRHPALASVKRSREALRNSSTGEKFSKMTTSKIECEKFFRRLGEKLSIHWEKIATHCDFLSDDIDHIKHDYSQLEDRSFQFMVRLWNKFPDLPDWSGKLREALRQGERNDLVALLEEFISKGNERSVQGAHPTKDPGQAAGESCREALRTRYRTTDSYVQLIPRVDDEKKHIKDIFTDLTLEKSGKKLESYKDIFLQTTRDGDPIKRVILKGFHGRGKSTIMDKMAYDWACNEALQQFELVFVLRMSANIEQNTELIDSIFQQLLDEDTDVDKGALSSFISHNQDKVLILLDGFDELMTPALDETLFGSVLKMLNRKINRDCYVVVTTRPSHYDKLVTKSLIEEPFIQVRVEGFDKENIEKYVQRFYSEEHDKAKGLLQKIESSNVLSDLAKSPMLLLKICVLWRDNSTLPETMYRSYSGAMEYIFYRKTDMSPDKISKVTNEHGKIGLNGLLAPKQLLAFPEEMFEPSILTRQQVFKELGSHNIIQFRYKTVQEYCAGKYLQSLLETDTEQFKKTLNEMIRSEFNDESFISEID